MNNSRNWLGSSILGLVAVLTGVLILTNQTAFVKIVVVCSGFAMAFDGVYNLFQIKKWNFDGTTKTITKIKGFVNITAGLLAILAPLVAADILLRVVVYIFAFSLVFSAVVSIENAVVFKQFNPGVSCVQFIVSAIIDILLGALLFANPWSIASALVTVIGIVGIIMGLSLFFWGIRLSRLPR